MNAVHIKGSYCVFKMTSNVNWKGPESLLSTIASAFNRFIVSTHLFLNLNNRKQFYQILYHHQVAEGELVIWRSVEFIPGVQNAKFPLFAYRSAPPICRTADQAKRRRCWQSLVSERAPRSPIRFPSLRVTFLHNLPCPIIPSYRVITVETLRVFFVLKAFPVSLFSPLGTWTFRGVQLHIVSRSSTLLRELGWGASENYHIALGCGMLGLKRYTILILGLF